MSDEPRKRSRFDQIEPEPARKSRFDRRSRSPAARKDSESHRSRSPIVTDEAPGSDKKSAAAAAAAAAAAKINASINAKKGIQHVDVPPIRAVQSPTSAGAGAEGAEVYQQDGDFIKDIEVNDLRNRYTLTKGSTQKMIKEKTGADVTTRGNYYPDKSMATAANPPLYLHVTSTSKDGLDKAVKEIEDLMQQELPDLVDQRRFQRGRREPEPNVERDSFGRRKWPEERIPVELEPIPGFNLRAQVVGQGGQNVKYIQQETKCRVQIKGRGSGFMEQDTGMESDEQMYLHVAGPDPAMVQTAKEMALALLESVRQNYAEFKEHGPANRGGHDRNQGYDDVGQRGSYHQRDRNGSGSYGGNNQYGGGNGGQSQYGYGYSGQPPQSPAIIPFGNGGAREPHAAATLTAAQMDPEQVEQWSAYYAANPTMDTFAAVGGYGYYMAYFVATGQYLPLDGQGQAGSPVQQQQGYGEYGQYQSPANGAQAPPPPPPPDDDLPPPPPPPPGAGGNGYNSVPTPPGM